MKILVVDDDLLAAEMTGAILESANYEVIIAENAVEGLELVAAHPDLSMIVSDMNMPLISGIEFFHEVRAQQLKLPFIVLTGDEPDSLLQQEPALDGCLMKDFDLQDALLQLVHSLLQQQG